MHQALGRASSGNVRNVLFMLEELAVKYSREDYGPSSTTRPPTPTQARSDHESADDHRRRYDGVGIQQLSARSGGNAQSGVDGRDTRNTSRTNPGGNVPVRRGD
jgi:hypothetical protein